jgi:large subunit ribosomal protein L18
MEKSQYKNNKRISRHKRIRAKISGTTERPRLSVFRSNRYLYVQVIDDTTGKTLASGDTRKSEGKTLIEKSASLGKEVAEKAISHGVKSVVFDRGGFRYQGTIAALANAARESGLSF